MLSEEVEQKGIKSLGQLRKTAEKFIGWPTYSRGMCPNNVNFSMSPQCGQDTFSIDVTVLESN